MEKANTTIPSDEEIMKQILEDIKVDEKSQKEIAERTAEQSSSDYWYQQRRVRLTGSNFGKICKRKSKFEKLAEDISSSKIVTAPALEYGHTNEPFAREAYEKLKGVQVLETGLVVDIEKPWLGTSPDGILQDGKGIIEIKCPYKARDCKSIEDAVSTNSIYYLKPKGDGYELDNTHDYYYQIQGLLHVLKREYCDFVVWGKNFLVVVKVEKNEEFIENLINSLKEFYFKYYIFQLVQIRKAELLGEDVSNQAPVEDKLKQSTFIEYLGDLPLNNDGLKAKFAVGEQLVAEFSDDKILGGFRINDIHYCYSQNSIYLLKKNGNQLVPEHLEKGITIGNDGSKAVLIKKIVALTNKNAQICAIQSSSATDTVFIYDLSAKKLIKSQSFDKIEVVDIGPSKEENTYIILNKGRILKVDFTKEEQPIIESKQYSKGTEFSSIGVPSGSENYFTVGGIKGELRFFSTVGQNATNKLDLFDSEVIIRSIDSSADLRYVIASSDKELGLVHIGTNKNRSAYTHRLNNEQKKKAQIISSEWISSEDDKEETVGRVVLDRQEKLNFMLVQKQTSVYVLSVKSVNEGKIDGNVLRLKQNSNIAYADFYGNSGEDLVFVVNK